LGVLKMAYIKRNCDNCGVEYNADERNLKRGWGLCCSKSCAAKKRETSKEGYDAERVARNNIRRATWNENGIDTNYYGAYKGRRTSEGYKIYGNTAVDEFSEAVYDVGIGEYDEGDSEYWDNKDYSNCI
jgi:hypothetical protein